MNIIISEKGAEMVDKVMMLLAFVLWWSIIEKCLGDSNRLGKNIEQLKCNEISSFLHKNITLIS